MLNKIIQIIGGITTMLLGFFVMKKKVSAQIKTSDNLEVLQVSYQKEQDDIAKKRKRGEFRNEQEDIKTQKASWENFLIQKYQITKMINDRNAIVDYFFEQAISLLVTQRDDFNKGIGSVRKDIIKRRQLFLDFEDKMVELKLIKEKSIGLIDKHLMLARKEEIAILGQRKPINIIDAIRLCEKQFPIAIDYLSNFK